MPPKKETTVTGSSSTGTRGSRKRGAEDISADDVPTTTNANEDGSRKSSRTRTRTTKAVAGEPEAATKKPAVKQTTNKRPKKAASTTAIMAEPEDASAQSGTIKTPVKRRAKTITTAPKPQKIEKPKKPTTRKAHLVPDEKYARLLYIKRLVQINRDALRGEALKALGPVIETLADAFNELDGLAPEPNIGPDDVQAPVVEEEEEEDGDDVGETSSVAASKSKKKGKERMK